MNGQERRDTPRNIEKNGPLGVHPVDISLERLQGIIEYALNQPVTLAIPGIDNYFDHDVTGAVSGGARIIAYGAEGTDDIWELPLSRIDLEKLDPRSVYVGSYLDQRQEYTSIDRRNLSRMLLADAEVKPLKRFARDTLMQVFNIPMEMIADSGIDLSDVSHSQAERITDVIRHYYTQGKWRETLQLAMAASHIHNFVRIAEEASERDLYDRHITIADSHIRETLQEKFRTDIDLLIIRALQQAVRELRATGRDEAADHAQAWIELQEEGMALDSFPPEITINDILKYPSYLNPRPDKGTPVISSFSYLAGGTTSRNSTILYPDGSVYAVDYPHHARGARPIKGKEEDGYSGNLQQGTVEGYVHVDREWMDFAEVSRRRVARNLVEGTMQKGVSFKNNIKTYNALLLEAQRVFNSKQLDLDVYTAQKVKTQVAAILIATECMERARVSVGSASALYDYSISGWSSKKDIERVTGIELSHYEALSPEAQTAFSDFGTALYGYELALLAQAYEGNHEFSTHIAHYRKLDNLELEADDYLYKMRNALARLIGNGPAQNVVKQLFSN